LNNICSLTAIGVYNGDFMKFEPGVSAVTLAGGRTYCRLLPAHEGQHAIRWFIHDPAGMFTKGTELEIPRSWINSTLAGLQRVYPFIDKFENLAKSYNHNDNIALQIEYSDRSDDLAAMISLAPASSPSPRKLVIQRKGEDRAVFLNRFSPLVEPLHYLLLLPDGNLGWSIARRTRDGRMLSQARWFRTRFYMNAEQMSG
jgi:hypothetical protein